jgi:hypothetical protein
VNFHLSHAPAFLAFLILQIGSHAFSWGRPQIAVLLSIAYCIAGITGLCHNAYFSFLAVLGFELRVLHLLGRHSTTSAMSPAPLLVLFIKMGASLFAQDGLEPPLPNFHFLSSWDYRHEPMCLVPPVLFALVHFSDKVSCFCLGWSQTDAPVSVSKVARIISMYHRAQTPISLY